MMHYDKEIVSHVYDSGNRRGKFEVMIRMDLEGFDKETIAKITGFSKEEIEEFLLLVKSGKMIATFHIAEQLLTKGKTVEFVAEITNLDIYKVREIFEAVTKKQGVTQERESSNAIKRDRVVKNPNRKNMRVGDMSFSVNKDNQRLLQKLRELRKHSEK